MNKPWKSKALMEQLCASIGAELNTERQVDPNGIRVYTALYKGKLIGFRCMKDTYTWLLLEIKKLPASKRPK